MKLEAKYRFSYISNSTKYSKMTSGVSRWVNSRWPPRWLPKSVNGYNFCSRTHSLLKSVAKCRFSSMSNSTRHIKITSDMSKWVNPRWLTRWLPIQLKKRLLKSIKSHNFHSMADSVMKLVAKHRFSSIDIYQDT